VLVCCLTRGHAIPSDHPSSWLSSNFGAGGRDSLASRKNWRRPAGRAGNSYACVSYSRKRPPRPRRHWKHRRWTRKRRKRTTTRRRRMRKPADRYARSPATATSSTVACRDDGRSPWRCDDGCSSSNSRPRYYRTLADTFAAI